MGLFDFLDLNAMGDTAAGDLSSAILPQVTAGARQGQDDVFNAEMNLAKLSDFDRKMFSDALDIKEKQRQAPLKDLLLMQKANVPEPDVTPDLISQAGLEVLGEDKSRWPKSLTPEIKNLIQVKAKDLARSQVPRMDPFAPENWMAYAGDKAVSDFTADRIKFNEQMARDEFKAEKATEKMMAMFENSNFQKQQQIESSQAIAAAARATSERNTNKRLDSAARLQAERERNKAISTEKKRFDTVVKEASTKLAGYGDVTKNKQGAARFKQFYNEAKVAADRISAAGGDGASEMRKFEDKYAKEVSALGLRQVDYTGGVKGPAVPGYKAAQAKPKAFVPGRAYKEGEVVIDRQGITRVFKDGKFKLVK